MSPQVKALPSRAGLDLTEENADCLAWVAWVAWAPRGRGRDLATSRAERMEGAPCGAQSTLGNDHRPQELGPENPSLNPGIIVHIIPVLRICFRPLLYFLWQKT